MDPGDFSTHFRPQLSLRLYVSPKKLHQGLLHGHCQDWTVVHRSHSSWENERIRHLASYTALWGLEQRREGTGKSLGVGQQLGFYYGLPSYHIALQKEIFGNLCFNMFCSFQRKKFTDSGSSLQGGVSSQRRAKRSQQWARSCLCASA